MQISIEMCTNEPILRVVKWQIMSQSPVNSRAGDIRAAAMCVCMQMDDTVMSFEGKMEWGGRQHEYVTYRYWACPYLASLRWRRVVCVWNVMQ